MKILCLHGYTQNRDLFARKSSAVRKALTKAGHDLLYVSGPLHVKPSELPFEPPAELLETDMRSWYNVNPADPNATDLTAALETIREAVKTNGPFDGLLGFSQGAGLTAILTRYLPQIGHPPLKFCIMYSSFQITQPQHQHWYEPPLDTPSLHIMGTLDTVVTEERSMRLYNSWDPSKRQILKHPGGHFVPSTKPLLETVKAFIAGVEEPDKATSNENSSATAASNTDDWSAFDSIGRS